MNWEERKAKATARKRELANRIESGELLIAGIRFYLALLKPGEPILASLVTRGIKTLPDEKRPTCAPLGGS